MTDQPSLSLNLPDSQPQTSVDGYQFEPIKGYPMLHWKGKRPFSSTQYYPAQLKEVHGTELDGWHSKIYWGDNLQVMSHLLKEFRGKVNLVYIDPPFDSKANYSKKIQLQGQVILNDPTAFEEKQYEDIWTNDEYLQFIYERLILVRELISEDGSIYIHCDYHRGHYIKCILDEVFGPNNFQNEIVWQRTSARSDASTYNQIHDVLLFYTKSSSFLWNHQYKKHNDEYIADKYNQTDANGKCYQLTDMTSPNPRPNMMYEWMGFSSPEKGWRYSKETMQKLHNEGRIWYPDDKLKRPRLKKYLDEASGRPLQSVWTDIYPVNSQARERLGYPTQKPEALLERIIKASSNLGDIVFDCFMGSGTTQSVAMKLGRRFIGADINLGAVQITTKRLLSVAKELEKQAQSANVVQLPIPQAIPKLRPIAGGKDADFSSERRAAESAAKYSTSEAAELEIEPEAEPLTYYTGFEVYNVNHYDVFRNPPEAKDLLLEALEVNRLDQGKLFDGEKDGRMVKIMPVNRIATRADLNELIAGFDYKVFEKRYQEHPHAAVEKITLVCMGHEPDLAAQLKKEVKPFELDVQVVDILRDKQEIQFKRDSEASIVVKGNELVIEAFYPMNLLGKLSLQQENVEDWRELVESVMIDWNYDGAIFQPLQVDIPNKNELVSGRYPIPDDAGTIRVKITDLLSESLEVEIDYG
jgi:adenine-specific DNA-methyltransferase